MSKLLKKSVIIFFTSLAVIGLGYMSLIQKPDKLDNNTLAIGLQSGYPPFEYRDENGKIVGFDIDVGEKIAAKLGKKLLIKDMDFDGEVLSLKQGKIDLILSGMNIIPSREKEIFMIPYHGSNATSLSLIFWKEIPNGIKSIEDLRKFSNLTISVGMGTVAETYLSKYPDFHVKSFEGSLSPLMDVKYGKSIANLVETDVAEYLQKQHSEVKVLQVPLPDNESIGGFGIGVNKNNEDMFKKVTAIIQELKSTGELKQIADKWFKEESNE